MAKIQILKDVTIGKTVACPLYASSVSAGFPSMTDDFIEKNLDLNHYLITNPTATFFARVQGDSMKGVGILDGDLVIVDRSLTPCQGSIVIAVIHGELTLKILSISQDKKFLIPANPAYPSIELHADQDVMIWGVVRHAIHSFSTPLNLQSKG